jgi:hypothetical protein
MVINWISILWIWIIVLTIGWNYLQGKTMMSDINYMAQNISIWNSPFINQLLTYLLYSNIDYDLGILFCKICCIICDVLQFSAFVQLSLLFVYIDMKLRYHFKIYLLFLYYQSVLTAYINTSGFICVNY